jgi:hypothetical protein
MVYDEIWKHGTELWCGVSWWDWLHLDEILETVRLNWNKQSRWQQYIQLKTPNTYKIFELSIWWLSWKNKGIGFACLRCNWVYSYTDESCNTISSEFIGLIKINWLTRRVHCNSTWMPRKNFEFWFWDTCEKKISVELNVEIELLDFICKQIRTLL